MNRLANRIRTFLQKEEGATMIEYGLMIALIAVVCLATIVTIGTDLNVGFTKISTEITKAVTT